MTGTEVSWESMCQVWEHLGAPEITLGEPGNAGDKLRSADDKPGSTGDTSGSTSHQS